MIARGHGKTFGTFEIMMEALAELGRYDELDVMWRRVVTRHLDSVPRATFGRVMSLYSRHRQPLKVLEVGRVREREETQGSGCCCDALGVHSRGSERGSCRFLVRCASVAA